MIILLVLLAEHCNFYLICLGTSAGEQGKDTHRFSEDSVVKSRMYQLSG